MVEKGDEYMYMAGETWVIYDGRLDLEQLGYSILSLCGLTFATCTHMCSSSG